MTAFQDRTDAGRKLAAELAAKIHGPATVAAIPRGGIVVAAPIAEHLHAPLAVVYARKLTSRVSPELAFGALDEDGQALLEPEIVADLQLTPDEVERAKRRVWEEIRRRMIAYAVPALAHFLAPGLSLVLVDDGLATGLTMKAALAYARRHGAQDITVAVPCASARAAAYFHRTADRFVSLIVDEDFMAVGRYYEDFSPVTDEEVIATVSRPPRAEAR